MKKMKRFLVALLSCLTAVACVAGISACGEDEKKDSSAPAASSSSEVVNSSSEVVNSSEVADSSSEVVDSSEEAHVCEFPVVESLAATCEEDGYTIYGACECGVEPEVKEVVVPALGHANRYVKNVEPTCTEWGSLEYFGCERCGLGDPTLVFDVYLPVRPLPADFETVGDYVAAYNQWKTEMTAYDTAKTEWENLRKPLAPTGHKLTVDKGAKSIPAVAPTCTEVGYKAAVRCKDCDYIATPVTNEWGEVDYVEGLVEVAANGHFVNIAYTDYNAQAATCTAKGWTAYRVCGCGYNTLNEEVKYSEMVVAGALKDEYKNVAIIEHTLVDVEGKAATCTTKGWSKFQRCTVCAYQNLYIPEEGDPISFFALYDEVQKVVKNDAHKDINALGHDYVVKNAGYAPSCHFDDTKSGDNKYVLVNGKYADTECSRCHDVKTGAVITATHSYALDEKDTVSCTPATKCVSCGKIDGNKIARSHEMRTVNELTVAASCETEGLTVKKCANCEHFEFTTTNETGHNWTKNFEHPTKATCKDGIYKENAVKCSATNCNKYALVDFEGNTIDIYEAGAVELYSVQKTDHEKKSNFVAATCVATSSNDECVNCRERVFFEAIKGHTYAAGDEATCLDEGNCTVCGKVPAFGHKYTRDVKDRPADKNVDATAWVAVAAQNASCQTAGWAAHKYCALCGEYGNANMNNSDLGETIFNVSGQKVTVDYGAPNQYKGDSDWFFYIAQFDHKYYVVKEVVPTCKEDGTYEKKICVTCGYTEGGGVWTKVSCASTESGSCLDTVKCDAAYAYDAAGNRVAKDSDKAVRWAGCGERFENPNPSNECTFDTNGKCIVCGECKHGNNANDYLDAVCPDCKKEAEEAAANGNV